MAKMSRIERAKQFMPFAALRGFEKMVEYATKERCEKKILDEAEIFRLSEILGMVKRGDVLGIKHFEKDCYRTDYGVVSEIDLIEKYIKLVKKKIYFEDIYEIYNSEKNIEE